MACIGEVTCTGRDLGERDHLEDLVVDGRTILKRTFKNWMGGVRWIHAAQ